MPPLLSERYGVNEIFIVATDGQLVNFNFSADIDIGYREGELIKIERGRN